jgi:branched-subunit amino acid ABC-type transport system permease component
MTTIFRFAVIGLGAGSLYALAALGLVLIFRGSKVVNFAQGVMGMMAAYVFYEVHQNWHVTDFLAIPAGLLTSAALGAAFFYLVIRRLRDASNLIKVVATLALLLVTQEAVLLIFGAAGRPVSSILPTNSVTIFGAPIGEDRLWIFGIVIVLTSVLWAVYKYTRFGLATSAVAENPTAAAALAISPDVIAVANWAIGAALGGLAAIFLVPITSLSSENLSLIVIPILAAAVIGGFSSFPITTIAGVALGIAQSEVTRYVSTPGWSTAVPFIFVTVILFLRGRSIAGREEAFGRMPSVGSGRVPPYLVVLAAVASLLCIWVALPFDWLVALQYQMLFAVVILSLVVVTGYAGQISLAQMGMAGIGALISAWLYSSHHCALPSRRPPRDRRGGPGGGSDRRRRSADPWGGVGHSDLGSGLLTGGGALHQPELHGRGQRLQHRQSHNLRSGGGRPRVSQAVRHVDPHRPGRPRADGGQPPAGTGGSAPHRGPHQ